MESFVVDAEIVLLFLNHVHTVSVYVREIGANNLRLVYQSYLDSNYVLRYMTELVAFLIAVSVHAATARMIIDLRVKQRHFCTRV